ncbi:MAG: GNAT family N-acetyltransferase [Candidatus Lutacidiplasmatales archaeon]
MSDGDPPQGYSFLRRLQRLGHPASDYFGVYAVEDGQLLSRIETLHLNFRGVDGPQSVVGIADVLTRPDGLGRGFARRLLGEVHRRELTRGRDWSFLWTRRSWGAHRLYGELGYRDVYSPPFAFREIPRTRRRALPAGYRWRTVRSADAARLERLLDDSRRDRLGFVPRARGATRLRFQLGWRRPENHRMLMFRARPVGYAFLSEQSGWNLSTNEVVLTSPHHVESMLTALEGLAAGRWLTFQWTTFVRDAQAALEARGYRVFPASHTVLMAKTLRSRRTREEDLRSVFQSPRFSSHRGDMF